MRGAACFVAVWLGGAGLAAFPSQAQEQVRLRVPDSLSFEILDLEAPATAVSRLSFDHVLLAPGNRLRISVRAEADLAAGIRLTATHPRGGVAFGGALHPGDYRVVFESSPSALAGGVDLNWILEPIGRLGSRGVTLRWKVESVPGAAPHTDWGRSSLTGREFPSEALPEAGSDPRERGPGRGATPRPPGSVP